MSCNRTSQHAIRTTAHEIELNKTTFFFPNIEIVQFAELEDAGQCLLRILSDPSVNDRSPFLSARKWAPRGYIDLDIDDYPNSELLQEIQKEQMMSALLEAGLFL